MRQRLTIILTFIVIIGALVIINTVTYVKKEKLQDSEILPNRSTYHSGPTGTRALHDFLNESGYKVMRWREAPEKLLGKTGNSVATFVVIGSTQLPFNDEQTEALRQWILLGGCFVLIDRAPDVRLLPKAGDWTISSRMLEFPAFDIDPGDASEMTKDVEAFTAVQPTRLTHHIESVMPSRFAGRLTITVGQHKEVEEADGNETPSIVGPPDEPEVSPAPVVNIADRNGALVIDYAYGRGRVIVLSDPYIVANRGIGTKDNLQLAINALTTSDGLIAFDEYHQGRGVTGNAFANYFSGTPVLAIAGQVLLLVLLILWTNARRFARPLPLRQVDRRSSLEFVASMAELQERSRAFDLAIENIYSRTRRVLARYAGVNYNSSRSEIAARIAARSKIEKHQLETLMRQCEEVINGQPINWRQAVDLVKRLRELERRLGLRMRSRDARQAAENI
ncbi:MAG TPA: DUF4350 domain-containing protein [Pyrinomonadaceae bacterium]|jgi:hypothetical protein